VVLCSVSNLAPARHACVARPHVRDSGEALPKRNHLGAERIVRPELPRVYVAIDATAFSSVLMVMVFVLSLASLVPNQQGFDVAMPVVAPASLDAYTTQVVVEITADRTITLNHTTVTVTELEGRLREVLATRRDKILYVIGAGSLRYGDIVPLIDAAHGAGAHRVGIVTERMLEMSRGQSRP
jgi:biopolymer transport protein TolR